MMQRPPLPVDLQTRLRAVRGSRYVPLRLATRTYVWDRARHRPVIADTGAGALDPDGRAALEGLGMALDLAERLNHLETCGPEPQ